MDLNLLLFPAPKCSYTIELLQGELIWIPKYSSESSPSSENGSLFARYQDKTPSATKYESPVLKSKSSLTHSKSIHKLQSKDAEDIKFSTALQLGSEFSKSEISGDAMNGYCRSNSYKPAHTLPKFAFELTLR